MSQTLQDYYGLPHLLTGAHAVTLGQFAMNLSGAIRQADVTIHGLSAKDLTKLQAAMQWLGVHSDAHRDGDFEQHKLTVFSNVSLQEQLKSNHWAQHIVAICAVKGKQDGIVILNPTRLIHHGLTLTQSAELLGHALALTGLAQPEPFIQSSACTRKIDLEGIDPHPCRTIPITDSAQQDKVRSYIRALEQAEREGGVTGGMKR